MQRCFFSELTDLNLSSNALTEFPFAVLACSNLRSLDLSNNRIGEFGALRIPAPRDAPALTPLLSLVHFALKRLDLSNNSIADFPIEFLNANLKLLENLNLTQ